jgi:Fe-S cluster assembly protein SufD
LASALADRRETAARRAREFELPTFKGRPGWEFTDISGLELDAFEPAVDAPAQAEAPPLFDFDQADALPAGVVVSTLDAAAETHPDLVARHLGSIVPADDLFVARNAARFQGGAFVYVPAGVALEQPILLTATHVTAGTELDRRTLIVLEAGAQAEVWEQYLSADADQEGVFNVVTELSVGDGAHLRYVCGQALSEKSWVFGTQRAEVGRDSSLDWVALGFGSANGRVRMETKLAGQGAEARVTGAYATHGRQHIDFDTTQEHAAANTTSDLAFRGVLQGRSSAVWKGNIIVDPGAQKTDAFQESRNLLISKRAHADAIPGLEIQANDVRCTHTAAVAQVDAEQIFYLRSHGLREDVAKRLVIEGFLAALVERFEPGPVRGRLAEALEHRLAAILDD